MESDLNSLTQLDDSLVQALDENAIFTHAKLVSVTVFHKPRGSKGQWIEVQEGESLRVTPNHGKKIRVVITILNEPNQLPTLFPKNAVEMLQYLISNHQPTLQLSISETSLVYDETNSHFFEVEKVQLANGMSSIEYSLNLLKTSSKLQFSFHFQFSLENAEQVAINLQGQSIMFSASTNAESTKRQKQSSHSSPQSSSPPTVDLEPPTQIIHGNLEVNGWIKAFSFHQLSDERLKTNVTDLMDALQIISRLKGKKYQWKPPLKSPWSSKYVIGLIAQEVQKVIPEVVEEDPETGILSVSYIELIPVLIDAFNEFVQVATSRSDALKNELETLRDQLELLSREMRAQDNMDALDRSVIVQNFIRIVVRMAKENSPYSSEATHEEATTMFLSPPIENKSPSWIIIAFSNLILGFFVPLMSIIYVYLTKSSNLAKMCVVLGHANVFSTLGFVFLLVKTVYKKQYQECIQSQDPDSCNYLSINQSIPWDWAGIPFIAVGAVCLFWAVFIYRKIGKNFHEDLLPLFANPVSVTKTSFSVILSDKKLVAKELITSFFCPGISILLAIFCEKREPVRILMVMSNGIFMIVLALISWIAVGLHLLDINAGFWVLLIGLFIVEITVLYCKTRVLVEKHYEADEEISLV